MKKLMFWYSGIYPYAFAFCIILSILNLYTLSMGNFPNTKFVLLLWTSFLLVGCSSFICKKKIQNKDIK